MWSIEGCFFLFWKRISVVTPLRLMSFIDLLYGLHSSIDWHYFSDVLNILTTMNTYSISHIKDKSGIKKRYLDSVWQYAALQVLDKIDWKYGQIENWWIFLYRLYSVYHVGYQQGREVCITVLDHIIFIIWHGHFYMKKSTISLSRKI